MTILTRSLLVILAHPDDESFPMGGTLAKYAAEGAQVTLICATRGEAGIPGLSSETTGQIREDELHTAAAALGLAEVRLLGYHDGQLAQAEPEQVIGQLVKMMQEIQPQVVITFGPNGISGHPDHLAIHHFTTQAFDRAELPGRLFYLAPSEATLQGCGIMPSQEIAGGPVAGIDVGEYRVAKVRAMQCHANQKPPYPGSPKEEAARLTCHEYFTLARPQAWQIDSNDLFELAPVPVKI
jgi:LmbE family N-acetylglucosaminyl deacetylase